MNLLHVTFVTILMNHKKEEHTKKVKSCWHFLLGFVFLVTKSVGLLIAQKMISHYQMNMFAVFVIKVAEASRIYYTTGKRSMRSMFHHVPNSKMESVFMERRIAGLSTMDKKISWKKITWKKTKMYFKESLK